jgi:hypothetical protein
MANDIKKFASDFDRIDRVKADDKILIHDSSDGIVKYATPGQFNESLNELMTDIEDELQRVEEKLEKLNFDVPAIADEADVSELLNNLT